MTKILKFPQGTDYTLFEEIRRLVAIGHPRETLNIQYNPEHHAYWIVKDYTFEILSKIQLEKYERPFQYR